METELKFQIPAAQRVALRRAVATASARSTRLQAVYVETEGRHLAAAGLALRLRKEGRVWVQTLKGRSDGLLTRLEHEVRLPPQAGLPALDPQRHQGTPAGDALAAALQGAGQGAVLRPLYRTDIRRLHRRVRFGGASIEIAYDHGWLIAGERKLALCEIEFELLSGPAAALPALAQRWAQRHGLWWDSRTKSERGLRLALGLEQVPAVKAQALNWPEPATPEAFWRAALQSALAQALPNAAEIASGAATPEHLHQLRVALRRLRTVLRVFAHWGGQVPSAQALEADWRTPFAQLGATRDADVQAANLRPRLLAAGAPAFTWPAAAATPAAPDIVTGAEFTTLLLRSLALALEPVPADPSPTPSLAGQTLEEAARDVLRPAWRRLLADATGFAQASTEEQHRARKRLKRLRYALEMLLPLYRRKPARRQLALIAKALEALGKMNDLQAAESLCRAQAAADPRAWFAVGWLAARHEPAQARAARALAALKDAPRAWRSA